jgi:hypothetical protein
MSDPSDRSLASKRVLRPVESRPVSVGSHGRSQKRQRTLAEHITAALYECVPVPIAHSLALLSSRASPALTQFAEITRDLSRSLRQCPQPLRVRFIRYYPLGKPTSFRWKYSLKYFCSSYKMRHRINIKVLDARVPALV